MTITTANIKDLESTISKLAAKGKGILAADESVATITSRFEALKIPSTEDTRRAYRELLVTTPGLNEYIAGVILFEETLNQTASTGQLFPELLNKLGIVPGIKVDKGLVNLPDNTVEQYTQGLDGLNERLKEYKTKGARFAKWRTVYAISATTPSGLSIRTNAESLAAYAAICQTNGIVPIVEPEILIDGDYTLERSAEVTENVLHALFHSLFKHKVKLEYIILKPSMVITGKKSSEKTTAEQIGKATVTVLRRTVPAAVPTINFLSGGQTPEEATANLNAINMIPGNPWNLSYSYARALQDYCMKTWKGETKNVAAAQKIFLARTKLNSLASCGKYSAELEKKHHSPEINSGIRNNCLTGITVMTTTMTSIDAKENFTDLLNHVLHHKERIIVTRRGKDVVAIVPLEDLQVLEAAQDKTDVREALDALKESKTSSAITLENLKDDLGIQS